MNEIVNKFLLVGDKFMPEIHLKQPGFTCNTCGPLLKIKKELKSFKSKDLVKRTQSDKVLKDKAFKIASDPN